MYIVHPYSSYISAQVTSVMITKGGLKVDERLVNLVENNIAPGTGVHPEVFWAGFGKLVLEHAARNKALTTAAGTNVSGSRPNSSRRRDSSSRGLTTTAQRPAAASSQLPLLAVLASTDGGSEADEI